MTQTNETVARRWTDLRETETAIRVSFRTVPAGPCQPEVPLGLAELR